MGTKSTKRLAAFALNFDRILEGTPRLVQLDKGDYRDQKVDPRHKDNPLILSLLSLPSNQTLATILQHKPPYPPADRRMPAEDLITLAAGVYKLLIPAKKHVALARAIWLLLMEGYVNRGPHSAASMRHFQDLALAMLKSNSLMSFGEEPITQDSAGLSGPSGSGKTSLLRRISQLFASVIYHKEYHMFQVPMLFIEMPFDGKDAHLLATSIFSELDRKFPTESISETFSRVTSGNAAERLLDALNLCVQLNVGVLVIDEKQNGDAKELVDEAIRSARRSTGTKSDSLTKRLITASNVAQMPIFFSGTFKGLKAAETTFHSLNRRISGHGSANWMPHRPTFRLEDGKRGEFEELLLALWAYQYTRDQVELTDEWVELFWQITQGLPDTMVKLFVSTQIAAITVGAKCMTPELVNATYANEFWASHFSLQALRGEDEVLAASAKDVYHPVATPIFKAAVAKARAAAKEARGERMTAAEKAAVLRAFARSEAAQREYHRGVDMEVDPDEDDEFEQDDETTEYMTRSDAAKKKASLMAGSPDNTYVSSKPKKKAVPQ